MVLLIAVVTVVCVTVGGGAFAQEALLEQAQEEDNPGSNIDFSKLPDSYLIEYQDVLAECRTGGSMHLYYDCSCFGLRFLEERVRRGAPPSTISIKHDLEKECLDPTNAAGKAYKQCLKRNGMMQAGTDPELMCECYANKFAGLLKYYKPSLQSSQLNPIKSRAWLECAKPGLAQKLYRGVGIDGDY